MSSALYISCLAILILLPEKIWLTFAHYLETLWENLSRCFPLSQEERRLRLIDTLGEISYSPVLDAVQVNTLDYQYKFYTNLISELLAYTRKLGGSSKNIFKEIRTGLIRDDQFEKKLKKLRQGSYLQFMATTLITWVFIAFSRSILELRPMPKILLTIVVLQILGLYSFSILVRRSQKSSFSSFGNYLKKFYLFKSLLSRSFPVGRAIDEVGLMELFGNQNRALKNLNSRLRNSLEKLQIQGRPINDDLQKCIEEIWFLQELEFEQFNKKVGALKLFIIPTFFLSGYFFYLFHLMRAGISL